jgi:hypothetical protein
MTDYFYLDTLRIDKGDVVIALSDDPEDQLLVQSKVLRQSKYFDARMSARWATEETTEVIDPDTGETVTVYKYGLKCVYDQIPGRPTAFFILEPGEPDFYPGDEEQFAISAFYLSEYADGFTEQEPEYPYKLGYPLRKETIYRRHDSHVSKVMDYRTLSIAGHKLLFAWLFNKHVEFRNCLPGRDDWWYRCNPRDGIDEFLDARLDTILEAVALTEYYGFLPALASCIGEEIMRITDIFAHIAHGRNRFLMAGAKLRHPEIYREAMKHIVACHCFQTELQHSNRCYELQSGQGSLPTIDGLDEKDLKLYVYIKRDMLKGMATSIVESLRDLSFQLNLEYSNRGRVKDRFCTAFIHNTPTTKARLAFLARGVFNEWLIDGYRKALTPRWGHELCKEMGSIKYFG